LPVPSTVTTIGVTLPRAVLVLRCRACTRAWTDAFLGAAAVVRRDLVSCLRTRLTADRKGVCDDIYITGVLEDAGSCGLFRGRF
jgi:hypothetical protein